MSRPKLKVMAPRVDAAGDSTMRYVELNSKAPWTTSEKSLKAVSAPLLWPQELRAALEELPKPTAEELEEDPFLNERAELGDVRKSCRNVNKFYIPISRLPPLGGGDPRNGLGK